LATRFALEARDDRRHGPLRVERDAFRVDVAPAQPVNPGRHPDSLPQRAKKDRDDLRDRKSPAIFRAS
jgi:hypothetical protein